MKTSTLPAIILASAVLGTPAIDAAAATPVVHIRGTISRVSNSTITIATKTGPVVVTISPKTRFAGVIPGNAGDIKDGTFIGTANVPGPGAARALEVVVFPKAMAGTGEGDYAWDLPAGGNRMSSMTNGTVMAPKASMMTNATVTHVQSGPIKTVSLAYKSGTKTVAIPPGAPVVNVVPATKSLFVVGAHVFAVATKSGDNVAFFVVGEQGAIPPM